MVQAPAYFSNASATQKNDLLQRQRQKSDFVAVLAERMSSSANGSYPDPSESMNSLSLGSGNRKPPSLFDCQVSKLQNFLRTYFKSSRYKLVLFPG